MVGIMFLTREQRQNVCTYVKIKIMKWVQKNITYYKCKQLQNPKNKTYSNKIHYQTSKD